MRKVIILNGPSCSGKSSIAKELQNIDSQLCHIQIDEIAGIYFNMFKPDYPHAVEFNEERINRQIAIREILINTALTMLNQGFSVCIDTGFDEPMAKDHYDYYINKLQNYNPLVVRITCSNSELERREKSRKDRMQGLALKQVEEGIYDLPHDISIDSSSISSKEIADYLHNHSLTSFKSDI